MPEKNRLKILMKKIPSIFLRQDDLHPLIVHCANTEEELTPRQKL